MLFLFSLLLTPFAFARYESTSIYAAVASEELPYTDVELALRLATEEPDDRRRADARESFWVLPFPVGAPELKLGPELLNFNLQRLLPTSEFRRVQREALERVLGLLLVGAAPPRPTLRPMPEAQAWRQARRDTPGVDQDPGWFNWEMKMKYGRNLNHEVVAPERRPRPLDVASVLAALRAAYREFLMASIEHFFEPDELSLYQETFDPRGTSYPETHVRRHGFHSFDELRARDFGGWTGEMLRDVDTDWVLALSLPRDPEFQPSGISINGEVMTIKGNRVGEIGLAQREFSLDALARAPFYEAQYQRFVADELARAISALEDRAASAEAILTRLRAHLRQDIARIKGPQLRRAGFRYLPQLFYLTRTATNPRYFTERDERARRLGRPSLARVVRGESRLSGIKADLIDWSSEVFSKTVGRVGEHLNQARQKIIEHLGREKKKELPRNTSRAEIKRKSKIKLFRVTAGFERALDTLFFDVPTGAAPAGPLAPWTPKTGATKLRLTSIEEPRPRDGALFIPFAEGAVLATIQIHRFGRTLRRGDEYNVGLNDRGEVVVTDLSNDEPVSVELGYVNDPAPANPAAADVDLSNLDVTGLIETLREGKLIRLASEFARAAGARGHLSAEDLLQIVIRNGRYSYDETLPRGPARGATGPFAFFSGYLNRRGLACVQCDGANALFALMLREIFKDEPRVEIREVTCLVRTPLATTIDAVAHARTQVFYDGRRAAVYDASPKLMDWSSFFKRGTDPGEMRPDAIKEKIIEATAEARAEERREAALADTRGRLVANIHRLRAELLDRAAVRAALRRGSDQSNVLLATLDIARRLDPNAHDLRALGASAHRYRNYLTRVAADDPTLPPIDLLGDPVALLLLDQLLAEVERFSLTCDAILAE